MKETEEIKEMTEEDLEAVTGGAAVTATNLQGESGEEDVGLRSPFGRCGAPSKHLGI